MDVPRFLTGRITRTILIVYQVTIFFLIHFSFHLFISSYSFFHSFIQLPCLCKSSFTLQVLLICILFLINFYAGYDLFTSWFNLGLYIYM